MDSRVHDALVVFASLFGYFLPKKKTCSVTSLGIRSLQLSHIRHVVLTSAHIILTFDVFLNSFTWFHQFSIKSWFQFNFESLRKSKGFEIFGEFRLKKITFSHYFLTFVTFLNAVNNFSTFKYLILTKAYHFFLYNFYICVFIQDYKLLFSDKKILWNDKVTVWSNKVS